jgi:hypothetical protein
MTALDPLTPASVTAETKPISKTLRVWLWLIVWVVAAAVMVGPVFAFLIFGWLFPIGLAAPFGAAQWTSPVATYGTLIVGWFGYIALSIHGLKQQQRGRYLRIYAILIALLALNVSGCRYEIAYMHFGC